VVKLAGRPLKFQSVEELQQKIDEYFELCDEKGKPYTISGLAYFLGTNRQTLLNYEERSEFFDTITRAKAKIEAFVEESLWQPKIATGVMFNLKNNFGWQDKQNLEHSGPDGGAIQFISTTPDVVNEDEWNKDH
jgi:hypothetical protein